VSACVRPVSAKVTTVEAVYMTPMGPVSYDQGQQIVFFYEDGTRSFLAPAGVSEIPHAWLN
jgi:hypothetical protein